MEGASQTEYLMPWIGALAVGSAFVAMGGQWASMRWGQPLLEIAARWSRLFTASLGVTYLAYTMQWLVVENRPLWSLVIFLFLGCLLFETVRTWLRVRGFSYEETSLFPRYSRHEESDEWPTDATHIRLREWIRGQGFRQVEVLRAYPVPEFCIREFHFDSEDELTRFSVSFIPRGFDTVYVSQTASSVTEDGTRYVTDNAFVPYGGCFPDNWMLDRKPLNRSPAKLLKRHYARMKASGNDFAPWADLPLDDVREQHRLLKKANEERGILNPRTKWEKHGRFSQEGRYRMWKEILLLNYFGIAA